LKRNGETLKIGTKLKLKKMTENWRILLKVN